MIKYYRRRQTAVEAFQMTAERIKDISEWPQWLLAALIKHDTAEGALQLLSYVEGSTGFRLNTEDGEKTVHPRDWILKDGRGKLSHCSPAELVQHYEPVDDDTTTLKQTPPKSPRPPVKK